MSLYYQCKSYLSRNDLVRRIAGGAFWSLTGTATAKLLVLLSGVIVANILGKNAYGELGIIRSTINMFVVFAGMGMGLTASKYISEHRDTDPRKAGSIYMITNAFAFATGIIITTIVLLSAPLIADKSLHAGYLTPEIRIGAFLLFFSTVNSAQTGVLAGFENFKAIAINTLIAGATEFVFLSLGAWWLEVKGAIIGSGISFFVLWLCNFISIRKCLRRHGIRPNPGSIRKAEFSVLWKFSLPATFSSLLVMPVFWYIKTLLVRDNGFGTMAVYDIADQWRLIILFIPGALGQIIVPLLSNIQGKKDRMDDFWKVLRINIGINVAITGTLSLLVILFGHYIMRIYGKEFTETGALVLLSISCIFTALSNVVGQAIASRAKMWVGFGFNLLWGIIVVTLSIVFLGKGWGASGLALAVLLSYVLHTLYQYVYLKISMSKHDLKTIN